MLLLLLLLVVGWGCSAGAIGITCRMRTDTCRWRSGRRGGRGVSGQKVLKQARKAAEVQLAEAVAVCVGSI